MVTFSIIIPCYNLDSIIERTIQSVLDQSYKNIELIVINDGSTDNSLKTIETFASKDKRIKVLTQKNKGVSSARNLGIENALGKYIYFLDGDDLIDPMLLETAYEIFKNDKIDMFVFGYEMIEENLKRLIKKYKNENANGEIMTGQDFQVRYFNREIPQCICSFIIKRSVIYENKLAFNINTHYGEDIEFQVKCNMKSNFVYYDSKTFFYYVERKGSAINRVLKKDNFDVYFRIENDINENIKQNYYNYLSVVFFYYLKLILKQGAEKETVIKLLEIDFILEKHKMVFTKRSITVSLLIFTYKLYFKNQVIKKYKIERKLYWRKK